MAIVAEAAFQAFGSGTSVTATFGATATSGRLLIAFMVKDDDTLPSSVTAGWNTAYQTAVQAQIAMGCYWKISDGTETSFTVTGDSEVYSIYGLELSGCDPTNPIVSTTGTTSNNTDLTAIIIPVMSGPIFFMTQIGVDRNRTFGTGWTNGTGVEPAVLWTREGAGAGDISQLVLGSFYDAGNPTSLTRFKTISAADEWGSRGVQITEPITVPIISLPTGEGVTTSPSAAQIENAGFTTDLGQGLACWYLSSSSTPPSAAVIDSGSGAITSGDQTVTATGALNFPTISGRTPNTTYWLHYTHKNVTAYSNVLSIDVSTGPFVIDLTFRSINNLYYVGANIYMYTSYQNVGTAYAVMTESATPPTGAQIVADTAPGSLHRTTDTSWSTSSDPNIFLFLASTSKGGVTIFEDTDYWAHAVLDDPASGGQSDVVTIPFRTLKRFVIDNITVTAQRIDEIDFEYDLTLFDSITPVAYFILNQSPTPLNATEVVSNPNDWTSGYINPPAADGTYQLTATGLDALTKYYIHVVWYDSGTSEYTSANRPVLSPGPSAATALATEELLLTPSRGRVVASGLDWKFVKFGVAGRFVGGVTEALTLAANPAVITKSRLVTTQTEQLLLTENPATVVIGGAVRDVNGVTEQLTLTTNSATVGQGQTAFGTTEELVLSFIQRATIDRGRNVQTNVEVLELTTNPASVTFQRDINGVTEVLQFTATNADIGKGRSARAVTEELLALTNAALIRRDREVNQANEEELLLLGSTATVGQGQTAFGDTEAIVQQSNQAIIRRDREVNTRPYSEILILIPNKARIGRGDDIDCVTEVLTLTTTKATIKRGQDVDANTEQLVLTANPARVDRGLSVRATTEALILTTAQATIEKSTDRRVTSRTHSLELTEQTALVDKGRNVAAGTEQLTLTANSANVYKVLRSTGVLLGLYGQEGVEIIKSPIRIAILMPADDGVTVETPSSLVGCGNDLGQSKE